MKLIYIALGCLLTAFSDVSAENAEHPEKRGVLERGLLRAGPAVKEVKLQWPLLTRFYTQQAINRPVWHDNGRLNKLGLALIDWVSSAGSDGLTPADYHLGMLEVMPPLTDGGAIQLRELLLTDAFFRLAQDLHSGHFNPGKYDPHWLLPAEPFDPVEALTQALTSDAVSRFVNGAAQATGAYQRLRQALSRYRRIEANGGWPQITEQQTLRPGEQGAAIERLRERLLIEGDHPDSTTDDALYFDDQLKAAVMRFQRRNGLIEDGLVGRRTRSVLNISVAVRIAQIRANMERWRWLPQDLGGHHLLVNTAGYELALVINGKQVVNKRTISGKLERQTPSFSSRITHLVVNPVWTVPRTIAVEDLLPKQLQDTAYLDRMGIQVSQRDEDRWVQLDPYTIDWSRYSKAHFPFRLRQSPGKKNSLGRIKFYMSNPHAIYLHDTPAKGLFSKPIRAFSSGCVRVQGAAHLARLLLGNGGQSAEKILDFPLQSGETRSARLLKPIPVFIVYFTSWVDDDGMVQFRPDIYNRNTGLLSALQKEAVELTASHQQAVANANH